LPGPPPPPVRANWPPPPEGPGQPPRPRACPPGRPSGDPYAPGSGNWPAPLAMMRVIHSPGKGLVIGLCGIAALLASFFTLPWISENGEDVTFKDLRDMFHPDEDANAVGPNATVTVPGTGSASSQDPPLSPSTTFVDPATVTTSPPPPGQDPTLNTVTPPLPTVPTPQSVNMSSDNRLDDLEQFTDWSWLLVLYLTVTAVLFSTWIVPTDRGSRVVTGFLTSACLGLVNLADKNGTSAPRILSTLSALYALAIQLQACWYLFWDLEGSPDPAIGALSGIAGAGAVVVACIIGTERRYIPC
jgi:hypothetical protein